MIYMQTNFTRNLFSEHQKGNYAIIIGIMVLLIAVGGLYYLAFQNNKIKTAPTITNNYPTSTGTNDSTKDWKILNNSKLGYSFKYPADKYTETIYTTEPYLYSVQYCPTKKPEDCAFPSNVFQVIAYDNTQNMDINNWLKTSDKSPIYERGNVICYFNDPRTVISTENALNQIVTTYKFTIDQETAKGVCKGIPLEGGGQYKYIFAEKGNKIYWISISLASKEVYPELEQILATFQFTN